MKKWIQKAIVQKIISYLPFSIRINYFFQKHVTKGVFLSDAYFYDRLSHATDHIESYKKLSQKEYPNTCLEIGTGWYPVVPIALFLVGAEKIYSVDIAMLTNKTHLKTCINQFLTSHKNGKLKHFIPYKKERFSSLENIAAAYDNCSLEQVLEKLNICYLIEDARQLSLASDSIDLVNSNNTFEHIYPAILKPILQEFKRVVKKGEGVQSHFIDMSDHFAHFDKSITIYNFLQFTDKQWKFIDNSIQPQNRLRIYEYEALYKALQLPITEKKVREGRINELKEITLAAKYKNQDLAQLAISHCYFSSKM